MISFKINLPSQKFKRGRINRQNGEEKVGRSKEVFAEDKLMNIKQLILSRRDCRVPYIHVRNTVSF